jgi:hypothetical protein
VLWFQLLAAIELFIIAHEYAHHICSHGTDGCASVGGISPELSKAQELEADYYAALLTSYVGAQQMLTFAKDGSAAVIALIAVDLLRRTRGLLATGAETSFCSDTHPSLASRLLNLKRIPSEPAAAEAVKAIHQNFGTIMEGIWTLVLPLLKDMHAYGLRPLPTGKEESQWLP